MYSGADLVPWLCSDSRFVRLMSRCVEAVARKLCGLLDLCTVLQLAIIKLFTTRSPQLELLPLEDSVQAQLFGHMRNDLAALGTWDIVSRLL